MGFMNHLCGHCGDLFKKRVGTVPQCEYCERKVCRGCDDEVAMMRHHDMIEKCEECGEELDDCTCGDDDGDL